MRTSFEIEVLKEPEEKKPMVSTFGDDFLHERFMMHLPKCGVFATAQGTTAPTSQGACTDYSLFIDPMEFETNFVDDGKFLHDFLAAAEIATNFKGKNIPEPHFRQIF